MLRSNRTRFVSLLLSMTAVVVLACGSNAKTSGAGQAAAGHANAGADTAGAAAVGGAPEIAGAAVTGGAHESMAGSAGADPSGALTVVFEQEGVLAGLALAGDTLYASIAAPIGVTPMNTGSIVSLPKGATGASGLAGATTVIAGISPRALAVVGGELYWDDGGPGSDGAVLFAPISGGTPQSFFPPSYDTDVQTRLEIVNGTLYAMAPGLDEGRDIWSNPLSAAGMLPQSASSHHDVITAVDADGTNIFLLVNSGTTDALANPILDLDEVEPGTGGDGTLRLWPGAAAVTFANYGYLVDDGALLYWSDGKTISSFPKAPTTADVPAVVTTFDGAPALDVQLLIDGPNIYVLTARQLLRVAKAGGTPVVLATSPDGTFNQSPTNALGMVVDDTFIYFLDAGHGRILKLPK